MTETMIIIIVAGIVIIAFGVLCLVSMFKTQKETQGFTKRMVAVEKDLGDLSQMVTKSVESAQKAEENIAQHVQRAGELVEQQAEQLAEQKSIQQVQQAAPIQPEQPVESEQPVEPASQAPPIQPAPQVVEKPPQVDVLKQLSDLDPAFIDPVFSQDSSIGLDGIDINDLIDDLEDVLPEIDVTMAPVSEPGQPTEIKAPQIQHIDYDIGKSGKKYTASELETLIRE